MVDGGLFLDRLMAVGSILINYHQNKISEHPKKTVLLILW